jgi:predicted nucleic acid-binding protein
MKLTHLLDTSVYSQRLRREPLESVVRRWSELGDDALAVSAIGEGELHFGLELKDSPRLRLEYCFTVSLFCRLIARWCWPTEH